MIITNVATIVILYAASCVATAISPANKLGVGDLSLRSWIASGGESGKTSKEQDIKQIQSFYFNVNSGGLVHALVNTDLWIWHGANGLAVSTFEITEELYFNNTERRGLSFVDNHRLGIPHRKAKKRNWFCATSRYRGTGDILLDNKKFAYAVSSRSSEVQTVSGCYVRNDNHQGAYPSTKCIGSKPVLPRTCPSTAACGVIIGEGKHHGQTTYAFGTDYAGVRYGHCDFWSADVNKYSIGC